MDGHKEAYCTPHGVLYVGPELRLEVPISPQWRIPKVELNRTVPPHLPKAWCTIPYSGGKLVLEQPGFAPFGLRAQNAEARSSNRIRDSGESRLVFRQIDPKTPKALGQSVISNHYPKIRASEWDRMELP